MFRKSSSSPRSGGGSGGRPVAATALCLLLSACAGGAPTDAGPDGDAPGYPVTLTNCGRKTTFHEPPERVVVMNGASVAEVSTLLALGLGDRIVVNAQNYGRSEIPGRARQITGLPTGAIEQNGAYDIPREAMLAQRPDLVLSTTAYGFRGGNGFATRDELGAVGAQTYVSPQGCDEDTSRMTIEDSHRLLRDLGRIFHVEDRAKRLIKESRTRIARTAASVRRDEGGQTPDGGRPRVMVVFSGMAMGSGDFSAVGARGIFNDILAEAGAVNAFADAAPGTFADLSKEEVAAARVDALVVIAYQDPGADAYARTLLEEFPQWPAAVHQRSLVLSDSMYLGPSNHLAVEAIAGMLGGRKDPAG